MTGVQHDDDPMRARSQQLSDLINRHALCVTKAFAKQIRVCVVYQSCHVPFSTHGTAKTSPATSRLIRGQQRTSLQYRWQDEGTSGAQAA
jgi:hypothetical protein